MVGELETCGVELLLFIAEGLVLVLPAAGELVTGVEVVEEVVGV